MACNQILVFSLLTLLMMPPPPFLNIIFFYIKPLLGQNIGVLVISTIGLHTLLHENNSLSPCLVLHTGLCHTLLFLPGHQENRVSNDRHSFACCFT